MKVESGDAVDETERAAHASQRVPAVNSARILRAQIRLTEMLIEEAVRSLLRDLTK